MQGKLVSDRGRQRAEILNVVREALAHETDITMRLSGFSRRRNALVYARRLPEGRQMIDILIQYGPPDQQDAAAAVYPYLEVTLDEVERIVAGMVGSSDGLSIRQPVELTSCKMAGARWFLFQPDSVGPMVEEMRTFFRQWTLPFLADYDSAAGLCRLHDRSDPRFPRDQRQKLRIAAALILCGRAAEAGRLLRAWFDKPGIPDAYRRALSYAALG